MILGDHKTAENKEVFQNGCVTASQPSPRSSENSQNPIYVPLKHTLLFSNLIMMQLTSLWVLQLKLSLNLIFYKRESKTKILKWVLMNAVNSRGIS